MTTINDQPTVPNAPEPIVSDKAWYKSKTLWVNALTLIASFLALPELQSLGLDAATLLKVQAIVNIGLRFITTGAVTK